MAERRPPQRIISGPTSITGLSTGTPAWVTALPLSTYTSLSFSATGYQSILAVSPGLAFQSQQINGSYSGLSWSPYYGNGGGFLFTGGGHAANHYPFSWVFDPLLPGWRELNVTPPNGVSAGATSNDAISLLYSNGAEMSANQADMDPGAILFAGVYWKAHNPNGDPDWGYPCMPVARANYGEFSDNVPFGFHAYNHVFPIPPNKLGMGAKGGWGKVFGTSITRSSGIHVPWGHKIDAASGVWSRMPSRYPPQNTGGFSLASNNMSQYSQSCTDSTGTFAYVQPGDNCRGMVIVNMNTGAYTVIGATVGPQIMCRTTVIPGTSIMVTIRPQGVAAGDPNFGADVTKREWILAVDVNPALPSRTWTHPPMSNNTMPIGNGDAYQGFGSAECMWVPEVGKFAVFGTSRLSTEAQCGKWPGGTDLATDPLKLFWITPPANVQSNWNTGTWDCEEEVLTVRAGDTKALSKSNRENQGTYGCTTWCSSLRGFLHFPRPATDRDNCFFIRSVKVP